MIALHCEPLFYRESKHSVLGAGTDTRRPRCDAKVASRAIVLRALRARQPKLRLEIFDRIPLVLRTSPVQIV
jgi:hypothetical protein